MGEGTPFYGQPLSAAALRSPRSISASTLPNGATVTLSDSVMFSCFSIIHLSGISFGIQHLFALPSKVAVNVCVPTEFLSLLELLEYIYTSRISGSQVVDLYYPISSQNIVPHTQKQTSVE